MDNSNIKQAIEGFTCLMRSIWNNPNLIVPKDIAEKYNIDKKFCEKEEIDKERIYICSCGEKFWHKE